MQEFSDVVLGELVKVIAIAGITVICACMFFVRGFREKIGKLLFLNRLKRGGHGKILKPLTLFIQSQKYTYPQTLTQIKGKLDKLKSSKNEPVIEWTELIFPNTLLLLSVWDEEDFMINPSGSNISLHQKKYFYYTLKILPEKREYHIYTSNNLKTDRNEERVCFLFGRKILKTGTD
jgi:hypothetical protein